MLDEVDFIARYDKKDVLGLVGESLRQLEGKLEFVGSLDSGRVRNVVVAAMGGSALPAEFVHDWLGERLPMPVQIVHGYELPGYVGKETLVVAASYSGTTEETLAALEQARAAGAQIAVVTSGGRVLELARAHNWASVVLPGHAVPRLGALSGVLAWGELLEAMGWEKGLKKALSVAAGVVQGQSAIWAPDRPTADNAAKQLAEELVGHPVVVYAGPAMRALAIKWKIDVNEAAHQLAWWNVVPELNHNEMSSWEFPRAAGMRVVELRSGLDGERVEARFEVMNALLSDRFAPVEVRAPEGSRLEQMLWTWTLGSYVSAYLGVLNQIDPSELPLVSKFKGRLG